MKNLWTDSGLNERPPDCCLGDVFPLITTLFSGIYHYNKPLLMSHMKPRANPITKISKVLNHVRSDLEMNRRDMWRWLRGFVDCLEVWASRHSLNCKTRQGVFGVLEVLWTLIAIVTTRGSWWGELAGAPAWLLIATQLQSLPIAAQPAHCPLAATQNSAKEQIKFRLPSSSAGDSCGGRGAGQRNPF